MKKSFENAIHFTTDPYLTNVFQPKGKMTLEPKVMVSVVGPVCLSTKGHYVIRMTKE